MKIDDATKSILKIIPDDAAVLIARAQEGSVEFAAEQDLARSDTSALTITDYAKEYVFQMIYSLLSHHIDIEEK